MIRWFLLKVRFLLNQKKLWINQSDQRSGSLQPRTDVWGSLRQPRPWNLGRTAGCRCRKSMLSTGSWPTIFNSGDFTMPGCLFNVLRKFTKSVPLMVTNTSGPPSVLMRAVASLMITIPSSTAITALRWLGWVWHWAMFFARNERAQVTRRYRSLMVLCASSVHSVTAKVSSSHSANVSSSSSSRRITWWCNTG